MKELYKLIILASIFSSCERVKLEQRVKHLSVCTNKIEITTCVWTYDYYIFPNTLEYCNGVTVDEACQDSIMYLEYTKAIPTLFKVRSCLQ